jgi:hypothetical protein
MRDISSAVLCAGFESGVPGLGSVHLHLWVAGFVEQGACGRNCVGLAVDANDATAYTDHPGHLESDEARAASQVQHAGAVGDTRELPPLGFAFSGRLGHEAVPLDLTIGQCQGVSASLAITHGGRSSHSSKGNRFA